MATYNLGRILPNFRGTWESAYNYFIMDIVYYNGSSYVAKSNINGGGNNPSINNNWQIIALKGELSGTLTPEQEQAIIDAIMAQGVVIDANYNHTDNNYTNADRTAVENINYGTLTIKRNNTDIGTFTANQNGSINIDVPISSTQLSDNATIQRVEESETVLVSSGVADVNVKPNRWIVVDGICSVLNLYLDIDITNIYSWNQPETHIVIKSDDNMIVNYANDMMTAVELPQETFQGETWLITIKGGIVIRFSKLDTI